MVEFVYQFQGFCQYRTQCTHRSNEDIRMLAANPNAWTYPVVHRILNALVRDSGITDKSSPKITPDSPGIVELRLLNCIVN